MRLFFARHGEKEAGDFYDERLRHRNQPLSERGRGEAQALAGYFANVGLRRILVSEYLRTHQTAAPVAAMKGISITEDGRVNEIDNGLIEMMEDEEIERRFPEFWADYRNRTRDFRFPGGETGEEVHARQLDLLAEALTADEEVLVVTHEGYIRQLACTVLGLPVYLRHKFSCDFCGITEIAYDPQWGEWRLVRFNQTPSGLEAGRRG